MLNSPAIIIILYLLILMFVLKWSCRSTSMLLSHGLYILINKTGLMASVVVIFMAVASLNESSIEVTCDVVR